MIHFRQLRCLEPSDSTRLRNPSHASLEHINRSQHDPDHYQNRGNLERRRRCSDKIQGAGNQAEQHKQQCIVNHGSLLSRERRVNRVVLSASQTVRLVGLHQLVNGSYWIRITRRDVQAAETGKSDARGHSEDAREIWTVGVAQHMLVPLIITLKSGESIRRARGQRIRLRINRIIYISMHLLIRTLNLSRRLPIDNRETA